MPAALDRYVRASKPSARRHGPSRDPLGRSRTAELRPGMAIGTARSRRRSGWSPACPMPASTSGPTPTTWPPTGRRARSWASSWADP